MATEINVRGLAELQKVLDTLPVKIERNIMRGALRAGMKPVMEQAKANVPVRTGRLRNSMRIGTRSRGRTVFANVRVRDFVGRFVEFGTRPHLIAAADSQKPVNRRASARQGRTVAASMRTVNRLVLKIGNWFATSVNHPGAKPRPFLRPALDGQAGAAVRAAAEYMKARLATKHGIDTAHIKIEGDE